MIKAGIFGTSAAAVRHIEQLLSDQRFSVSGIAGVSEERAAEIAREYGIPFFADGAHLVMHSDVIDITSCREPSFQTVLEAVRNFRYILMECTADWEPEDVRKLLKLAREAGVRIGVRSLKRQKKIFQQARKYIPLPQLTEMQISIRDYHSAFDQLNNLLFQSVDLLMLLNPSRVKRVYPRALFMHDGSIGAVDATFHFENGALAHMIFNRLLAKEVDIIQIFSAEGALKIDFLNNLAGYLPYCSSSRFTIPSQEPRRDDIPEALFCLVTNQADSTVALLEDIYPSMVLTHEMLSTISQQIV